MDVKTAGGNSYERREARGGGRGGGCLKSYNERLHGADKSFSSHLVG